MADDVAVGASYDEVNGQAQFTFELPSATLVLTLDRTPDGAYDVSVLVDNLPELFQQALERMQYGPG